MGAPISDSTNVNIWALLFLVGTSYFILASGRRNAVWALLAMAAFVPLGQEFYLFGLHVYFLRVLILVGGCRLLVRRELSGFKLNAADKAVTGWAVAALICGLIREPSAEIFGAIYNDLGVYFVFRLLMREGEDAAEYLQVLAYAGAVVAACMLYENFARFNPFSVFGGVPEVAVIRDGHFRCQGPFRHPILAGTFGATLVPLMVGLWQKGGRSRPLALVGVVSALVITVASASSGPLMAFVVAVIGFALWPLRTKMYLFRRGTVALMVVLALAMNAPVWYLIAKVSGAGVGGGGWHRSWLIQQFMTHITQWCYIGTNYTANWAPSGEVMPNNPNMMDITNHYVTQGIKGGAVGFILFLANIVICFKIVGRAVWSEPKWSYNPRIAWALGISLAGHCASFISVSYFDQIQVFWFWLLAALASIPDQAVLKNAESELPVQDSDFSDTVVGSEPAS